LQLLAGKRATKGLTLVQREQIRERPLEESVGPPFQALSEGVQPRFVLLATRRCSYRTYQEAELLELVSAGKIGVYFRSVRRSQRISDPIQWLRTSSSRPPRFH